MYAGEMGRADSDGNVDSDGSGDAGLEIDGSLIFDSRLAAGFETGAGELDLCLSQEKMPDLLEDDDLVIFCFVALASVEGVDAASFRMVPAGRSSVWSMLSGSTAVAELDRISDGDVAWCLSLTFKLDDDLEGFLASFSFGAGTGLASILPSTGPESFGLFMTSWNLTSGLVLPDLLEESECTWWLDACTGGASSVEVESRGLSVLVGSFTSVVVELLRW